MAEEKDYYRLLGVSRDAPEREIKKRYYELARKLHPDKARTEEERSANASQLAAISRAYNQLKDARKRAEYDAQIRGRTVSTVQPDPKTGGSAAANVDKVLDISKVADSEPATSNQAIIQQKKSMAQKAFVKGMQFYKQQEYRQALSFFQVAVDNDPESEAQYHLKYAQCLMKTKGSFTKAVQHAERACELEQYNIEFKMILAEINETAGVMSRAIEIYEDVLRWDPTHSAAKNSLNLLKAATGQGKSASPILNKLSSLFNKKK